MFGLVSWIWLVSWLPVVFGQLMESSLLEDFVFSGFLCFRVLGGVFGLGGFGFPGRWLSWVALTFIGAYND